MEKKSSWLFCWTHIVPCLEFLDQHPQSTNETLLNPEFLFPVFFRNNQDVKKYFHPYTIFRWHFFYPIQEINL
jgi:hypothetical protein